ncbi:MAG: glycosyltransferase family 39 protein [Chloroflexi bacterium]|nr:glycosyltransferase family 39 protein [Chloroflexota bacterium]
MARGIYYDMQPDADPQLRDLAEAFRNRVGQYEPPIIETLVAWTYTWTGGENIAVARVYETLFWLLAGLALFDLARRMASVEAAVVTLAYYLVLPFAVQASRSFQPDPLMTSAFVIGVYFLYRWTEEQHWKWAILAGVFAGFAVLVKIVIAFLVGGAAVAAVLSTFGKRFWKSPQVWAMALLMLLPALAYYVLGHPGRSTEYFFSWTVALIKLIASTNFYSRWLAFLGSLFGLTVFFLSLAGTLLAPSRGRALLVGLWAGYLLYGLTLPFQMYTHSYYHLQLVPVVALGLAPVAKIVFDHAAGQGRVWRVAFGMLILFVFGYQAWIARSVLVAEDFRHEPAFWQQIAEVIPADSSTVALTQDYGYRLMYFGWRKVSLWPLSTELSKIRGGQQDFENEFAERTAGKGYFLVTAFGQYNKQPDLQAMLSEHYPVAAEGDGYILFDLQTSP